MDITESPGYATGWAWAKEYGPDLSELFSSRSVSTPEFRVRLFKEASRRWPSSSDNLDNDLLQVAFVAGAMKAAVETLPLTPEALSAVMDAAMDMSMTWSVERSKARSIKALQAKPESWWRKKIGDASPGSVVAALSVAWRKQWAKERGRLDPKSRWEVLIDVMGSRELDALLNATSITELHDGVSRYVIESPEESAEIVSKYMREGDRIYHYPGEIVG